MTNLSRSLSASDRLGPVLPFSVLILRRLVAVFFFGIIAPCSTTADGDSFRVGFVSVFFAAFALRCAAASRLLTLVIIAFVAYTFTSPGEDVMVLPVPLFGVALDFDLVDFDVVLVDVFLVVVPALLGVLAVAVLRLRVCLVFLPGMVSDFRVYENYNFRGVRTA